MDTVLTAKAVVRSIPLVQIDCSGPAMRGSTGYQTRIWTIAPTEFVFSIGVMFIVIAKNIACSTYYSESLLIDHGSVLLLLRLPVKVLNTVVYLGLHKFAKRMGTDLVLTVLAFRRCMEVDCENTAAKNRFFR